MRLSFRTLAPLLLAAAVAAGCQTTGPANESQDWGVAPTTSYRTSDYHASTPMTVPGAQTLTTEGLAQLLQDEPDAVLIDVLGGKGHRTVPGAVWTPGAGLAGDAFRGDVPARFKRLLYDRTGGDKTRPVVFFCLSSKCWLSYNASLRAAKDGYERVYWYRGGVNAWRAAGMDTERAERTAW